MLCICHIYCRIELCFSQIFNRLHNVKALFLQRNFLNILATIPLDLVTFIVSSSTGGGQGVIFWEQCWISWASSLFPPAAAFSTVLFDSLRPCIARPVHLQTSHAPSLSLTHTLTHKVWNLHGWPLDTCTDLDHWNVRGHRLPSSIWSVCANGGGDLEIFFFFFFSLLFFLLSAQQMKPGRGDLGRRGGAQPERGSGSGVCQGRDRSEVRETDKGHWLHFGRELGGVGVELFTAIVARRPGAHGAKPDESADRLNYKPGGAPCFSKSHVGNYGKINTILGLRMGTQKKNIFARGQLFVMSQRAFQKRIYLGTCLCLCPNIKTNKALSVAERFKIEIAGRFK